MLVYSKRCHHQHLAYTTEKKEADFVASYCAKNLLNIIVPEDVSPLSIPRRGFVFWKMDSDSERLGSLDLLHLYALLATGNHKYSQYST